jgi:hypothetical protein
MGWDEDEDEPLALSDRLGNYQFALIVLPIGLVFGSFVPLWFIARALGYVLGIPENAPVRDQPYGFVWLVLLLATMWGLMFVGFCVGSVLNALILRLALCWSWSAIREGGVCPPLLVHWLEARTASAIGSQDFRWDDDPMYDLQLDDSVGPSFPLGGSSERVGERD